MKKISFVGMVLVGILCMSAGVLAAVTGWIYPSGIGTNSQLTPTAPTSANYKMVDENPCNGLGDYNYVAGPTGAKWDSYDISLSAVPNGSTITKIEAIPCVSANNGASTSTMQVFYIYDGVYSYASSTSVSGLTPVEYPTVNFNSLALSKNASSTMEIGVVASGAAGFRISGIRTRLTY